MLISNWTDVDAALERLGMLDLEISEVSAALGRKLYELLGEHAQKLAGLKEDRHGIESSVESFCLLHKSDFAKKRSRKLFFGKIAFRVAERIEIPEEFEEAAIATLKKLGLSDCIEIRERIDRNALKRLPDADLARCGIRRDREDHFRIEPDIEVLCEKLGKKNCSGYTVDVDKLSKLVKQKGGGANLPERTAAQMDAETA